MTDEWGSDAEVGEPESINGLQEFDMNAFAEWIETQADANDMSQQDLADELISSYWLFKELMQVVDESESDSISNLQSSNFDFSPEQNQKSENASTVGESEEATVSRRTPNVPKRESSPDEDTDQVGDLVKEVVEVLKDISQEKGKDEGADQKSIGQKNEVTREEPLKPNQPGENILLAVLDHYRQILTDLEELRSKQGRHSEEVSNYITDLDDRLSECEDKVEQTDEIADLKETTNKHTQEIDAVRDRVHGVEQKIEQIRSSQEDMESRLEKEFDTIEAVFDRFLRDIGNLETHLEELTEEHRNDMQSIQHQAEEQDQLTELKWEALRLGIKEGQCEECGEGVNISLLESTDCPNCDRVFTDISRNKWIPFKSPVLETRPAQADPVNISPDRESNLSQFPDSDDTEGDWSDQNEDSISDDTPLNQDREF